MIFEKILLILIIPFILSRIVSILLVKKIVKNKNVQDVIEAIVLIVFVVIINIIEEYLL
ncbi:hypothetical protein Mh1949_24480 [Mannheimia haemolytica]|nr:hypothetical protein F382_03450 [Mannheimia haemolytica D153]AGQ38084.1 hypothetical protein J450_02650 [Mannheimia haemolytica D171]AGQ40636.1 hypothetical protein J451_03755 [Mannheimia haemolytica D174]AGR75533.1 hypothetical protein N220_09545 [Mannheimia haemolytica USMARC_2286]EEY09477.1 hypothetical protein COI_1889 [Mannheimia haemolytica serotype A2 str. OVINE]EPZ01818.1 hypothetical protein L279_11635 [Mannheimia haemolytica D38]EPZ24130.1 hypothetical protein L277_13285 [Mannhei